MLESLPLGVGMDPVVDLLVVREIQVAKGLHRTEGRSLRAKIRPTHEGRLNVVADGGVDALKVLQGNLALALKYPVDVVLAAARGDIPFGNIANALGMFKAGPGNERDVSERCAAKGGDHAAPSRLHFCH